MVPSEPEISATGGDKGVHFEFFGGDVPLRKQFGDGGFRFPLGPLKTEGKKQEKLRKMKEHVRKRKTGRKMRKPLGK